MALLHSMCAIIWLYDIRDYNINRLHPIKNGTGCNVTTSRTCNDILTTLNIYFDMLLITFKYICRMPAECPWKLMYIVILATHFFYCNILENNRLSAAPSTDVGKFHNEGTMQSFFNKLSDAVKT